MKIEEPVIKIGDVVYHISVTITNPQNPDDEHRFLYNWEQAGIVKSIKNNVLRLKSAQKEHKNIAMEHINKLQNQELTVSGYASSLMSAAKQCGEAREQIVAFITEKKRFYEELLKATS